MHWQDIAGLVSKQEKVHTRPSSWTFRKNRKNPSVILDLQSRVVRRLPIQPAPCLHPIKHERVSMFDLTRANDAYCIYWVFRVRMESRFVLAFQDDFEARGVRETENTTTAQISHEPTGREPWKLRSLTRGYVWARTQLQRTLEALIGRRRECVGPVKT